MDILIPLGRASTWQNNELRFCLRSIEKFATGYDRIFVVGDDPGFLISHEGHNGSQSSTEKNSSCASVNRSAPGVRFFPLKDIPANKQAAIAHKGRNGSQSSTEKNSSCASVNRSAPGVRFFPLKDIPANKQAAIAHKIFWAFQNTDISNTIVLFNDDYVLRERVNLSRLLSYQRGPLQAALASQEDPVYRACLEETMQALQEAGRPAYHYDIHVPITINRQTFVELKDWWAKSVVSKNGLVVKSIYANNALLYPGPVMRDCKLRQHYADIEQATRGRFVFSYSDAGLTDVLKRWLTETFPERSRWEKGGSSLGNLTQSPQRTLRNTKFLANRCAPLCP